VEILWDFESSGLLEVSCIDKEKGALSAEVPNVGLPLGVCLNEEEDLSSYLMVDESPP
jgi:hypothetical protein